MLYVIILLTLFVCHFQANLYSGNATRNSQNKSVPTTTAIVEKCHVRASALLHAFFAATAPRSPMWLLLGYFTQLNTQQLLYYYCKCITDSVANYITMLQKLSKCEVKVWLCWNLIILLPLRFNVKSSFGKFKQSKNVIFSNFRDSELGIW